MAKPLKKLAAKYGAALYIKHYPLTDIHPAAEAAAMATVAAHRQGKFWALYGLLFDNQDAITDATVLKFAKRAGLDMKRFNKDLKDPAVKARVTQDVKEGDRAGVEGTPTIFLNGILIEYDDLEAKLKGK